MRSVRECKCGAEMNTPFFRNGLPLLLFVVSGCYGLSQFLAPSTAKVSSRSERAFHLEQAHKVIMQRLATEEEVQLKPIHRPPSS